MKVKVFNEGSNALPDYKTPGSAGVDLYAKLQSPVILESHHVMLIQTGLSMQIPEGYELQIRPRSGLALKSGVTVLNTPGTIDADYRGEIGVILVNLSPYPHTIFNGDRIAQAVLGRYERIEWESVDSREDLGQTERGAGGFGHTGK